MQRAAERSAVTGERDQRDGQNRQQQPASLGQIPAGEPREAECGGQRRSQDRERVGRHRPAGRQPGLAEVEVADPVAGPAQQFRGGHGARGGVGLLDERHEVLAVHPQQKERDHPPGRREQHTGEPPGEQSRPTWPGAGEQIEADGQQRRQRRRRVDAAHEGDQQRRTGRGRTGGEARVGEREQDPRQQRAGERGGGGRADDDGEGGPQGVAGGCGQPGRRCAHAQPFHQPQRAPERGRDDQRHPQPLGQPDGQPRQIGQAVIGEGREGVADVLVGDAAEAGPAVPQLPEVTEELPRGGGHAELRLERHPPRRGQEEAGQGGRPEGEQPASAAGFARRWTGRGGGRGAARAGGAR